MQHILCNQHSCKQFQFVYELTMEHSIILMDAIGNFQYHLDFLNYKTVKKTYTELTTMHSLSH